MLRAEGPTDVRVSLYVPVSGIGKMFIFQQIYLPYNLFQYANNILDAVMGPSFVPYASSVKLALGTWKGEDLVLLKNF